MNVVAIIVGAIAIMALWFAVAVGLLLLTFNGLGVADWLGLGSLSIKAACGVALLVVGLGTGSRSS